MKTALLSQKLRVKLMRQEDGLARKSATQHGYDVVGHHLQALPQTMSSGLHHAVRQRQSQRRNTICSLDMKLVQT